MATLDKLVKTVESLRLYQSPAISMDQNLTKKEKMTQCSNVAENVCQQALVKNNSDFSKYLTVATEMFFTLSNDEDADIRLLADECLSKVVKQLSESGTNVGRIQVELYKEIKKNGSSRSLRSALSKFAAICKQIRPQKCRAYIVNLIPCLIKIATTRKEEAVHETLAEAMNTLFSYLGHYANDNEIDQLLKTFLNNLSDPSPSIRRSTASILTSLCVGSRKPPQFTLWLFKTVISNCIPCTDPHSIPNEKVLGLLVGSRPMIPLIAKYEVNLDIDANVILEKSLQLYELCICLMNSADVTIVSQALETLQQLLGHPSMIFKQVLTSPSGIRESSIYLSKDLQDDQKEEHESLHETLEDELHEHEESMTSSLERGRIKLMDSVDIPTPSDNPEHDNQEESKAYEVSNPFEKERPKSGHKGDIGSFLDKDVPLIFCSRKLVMQFLLSQNKGKLIADSKIRVSTKALAIGCLTHAITMAPKVFLLTLYSDSDEEDIVTILIRDVANYTQHEDPQLRGSMVILIGQVLKGALVESGGDLALWYNGRRPDHNDTLQILKDLLDDELASAMATKHILSSALKFLPPMLKSIHSRRSISLLKDLLSIPYSSSYKYWLVKVELCKLLANLPYMAIHHIVPDQALQEACIGILLGNLGDEDSKVREKAATALTKAHFYWPQDGDKCSITSAATKMASKLLLPIIGESIRTQESNHQRLTFLLQNQLLTSQSPNMTSGTVQALLNLSKSGLVSMDLLNYCSKILSSRSLISADISFHANIMKLISNLVKSLSHEMKKNKDIVEWKKVCGTSHEITTHCFVVLNILQHLIDCIAPDSVIKSQSGSQQVNQNSITNPNASPIKLKLNELTNDSKKTNEEQSKIKLGQFNESHHYMRLFENLRNVYTVERNSLGTQEKVKSLMIETLNCLQHLLEYTTSDKSVGKITEELLTYLKSTFAIDPFSTLKCVEALLRCIFATHFAGFFAAANQGSSIQVASPLDNNVQGSIVISQNGLFFPCFDQPYNELVHTFHLARDSTSTPDRSESMLFRQTALRQSSSRRTSKTSVERSTLSNYIRMFEPMVIRALKHYTITSNVEEQSQVLKLLIQLVHLRVNYCLLDSDKIFVTFVLKQLDLIEEGQMYRAPVVIPEMFRFLVLLSYEKYHSKPIIDVPKILQLCEGLFASGQDDETFVMPALIPVAEDLFCSRTTSDQASDLEAQREVMITMLIKLLPYSKVLSLATRMLRATKSEGDDRWRKLSRMLTEALIPLLAAQKIHIEEKSHLDLLHQIFAGLAPGTLRPVDPLLSAVLTCTVDLTKLRDVQRWLGFVVLSLPILTNQSPEEAILARLEELGIQMMMSTSVSGEDNDSNSVVMGTSMMSMESSTSTTNSEFQVKPEVTLAKFLLQAIGAACTKFHQLAYSIETEDKTAFLRQELSHLLLFVIYMFQSGRYYRVTKAAKNIAKLERDGNKSQMLYSLEFMTEMFIQLAHICPFITLQWCYILKLMQHSPQSLWYKVLQPEQRTLNEVHPSNLESESLNYEILRKGSLILLCDYLCENTNNVEYTTWVIVNYTQNLLSSVNESPVQDFVMSVHRSPSSSGLLLQAVMTRVSTIGSNAQVAFLKDALNVVENVHKQFAGKLVHFLVHKYLVSPHLSLTKQANFIACTRVEAMINSDRADVMNLFTDQELSRLLETLKSKKLTKRFGRLSTLLNRVATDFFDLSPIIGDDLRTFHPGSVSQVHLNREWLLGQIKVRCCHPDNMRNKNVNFQSGRVCAEILNSLEAESEILEIMSLKDFSISLLASCLAFDANAKGPLYSASKKVLIRQVKSLVDSLPRPFGLFKPSCWPLRNSDHRYSEWLENHFHSADFQKNLSHLLPAVQVAFESKAIEDQEEDVNALTRFTVLTMEFCKWIHCDLHGDDRDGQFLAIEEFGSLCLKVVALALNYPTISGHFIICKDLWATSMVLMLNDIIYVRFSITTNQVPICPAFKVALEESQETPTIMACIKLSELFSQIGKAEGIMPEVWYQSYKDILLGLCRLDRFTAYVRIPPELWTLGWSPMVDLESLAFPSIPIDYLHDKDILEVYVKRLLSLGWRSRTQFEESWMALLGVFSLSKEDLSDAEVTALAQASTVAVSAITGLLLQTLMLPQPGHPQLSTFIHHSRDTPRSFLTSKRGQQLTLIQNMINEGMKDIQGLNHLPVDSICNVERSGLMVANYGLGQLSLHFIQSSIRYNSVSSIDTSTRSSTAFPLALIQREDAMSLSGLDTRSCLQFLQELYGQWLTEETPLGLLTETVRSMLALSDLFTETSQFQWMFDHFSEIQKTHPVEDEILTNLLRIGLCKCICICGLSNSDSSDLLERIRKSLESGIKAANLSTRIGCIHSFLYLVQCEGQPEVIKEVVNPLMPQIMDYLQTYLQHSATPHVGVCEVHVSLMWSMAFYILENHGHEDLVEESADQTRKKEWCTNMLKLAINEAPKVLETNGISHGLYLVILTGLERLVIEQSMDEILVNKMVKMTTDLLTEPNPVIFIPAVQLFLASMYSNKIDNDEINDQDPEQLMQAMEQMSILFDCVRRSGAKEAGLLCKILPKVLVDFFSASDVMNRVINEFISPGQPHQVLLSGVLFAVFQQAAAQDQLVMMQQWVLSSLPNFTKRSPVSHSMWCLTVFFISAAADNPYLQALFPYLQQRFGCYCHEDKRLFCLAARHFYFSLGEDKTSKEHFLQTVKSVAQPRTPYYDLLKSIENCDN